MVQKKSKKRMVTCLSVIGALILTSALVFIGCEEASPPSPPPPPSPIDRDGDRLIDIQNLDMLAHIRYNLAGTSYKTSETDSGVKCGANSAADCIGYELMRNLDFAVAGDYASGSVNMEWRPTAGGSAVAPGSATNPGWRPIGGNEASFATLFEGNGNSISNLYSRNATNAGDSRFGLFGQLSTEGVLRNLLIDDSNLYGGGNRDHVGMAVGVNYGTISNVIIRDGSVHGDTGTDEVGGLAGWSNGTIVASSSTALTDGNDSNEDNVGGLVGQVAASGTVTASYATGTIYGGNGNEDHVGGLVGWNHGAIRASYAIGNVNANNGNNEAAGGLVGLQSGSATIIASYATGRVDGGAGGLDNVGTLTGNTAGTITASYGLGTTSGGEIAGNDGNTLPGGTSGIARLTMPVAASPPDTAAPAEWQDAASHTMGAWDFGSATELPTLRYADYDGSGGTDYCASFSMRIPGTDMAITCDTTPLSGQDTLRSLSPFDLTVSATFNVNVVVPSTSATLTAIVHNSPIARPSTATTLTYYSSTDNMIDSGDTALTETDTIPALNGGVESVQDIAITESLGTYYYYACVTTQTGEADADNNCSPVITLRVASPVDSDGNTLINIENLDMLHNIRHNLAGTSYKISAGDSGLQCGTNSNTACTGYELMNDLDFAAASSYASGSINMAWRPTGGTPGSATNSGWQPIGNNITPFATRFEGNGNSISNLYSRNAGSIINARFGLFGQLNASGTLRDLLFEDSNVYGGRNSDLVGIAVGVNHGTISNVVVIGGSAHGGNGFLDRVGGLAGWSGGTIVASSASTTAVFGDGDRDDVGGLVGEVSDSGTVTASYATGAVDGGAGNNDVVGGLVGRNRGTIRASYATGNVNANDGFNGRAGGLVGVQSRSATTVASYATGDVDGGAGGGDRAGTLTGNTEGTVTASYAFGTTSGAEFPGTNGAALPDGAGSIGQLTMPGTTSPPNTAAPAQWQDATSHTMSAWDFGNNTQAPALRYADYDGSGGTDYCASFSNIPGTDTAIICGTTLLSGQDTLRSLLPFDLTVSATSSASAVAASASITLTAVVSNLELALPSTATTLTYYRSADTTVDTTNDTNVGTDAIPTLNAGATDTQNITVTVPATLGNYYYYACVATQPNEGDADNNCSDVALVRVTDAFRLVAGRQAADAFNFGIPLWRLPDKTPNALITRPSALFNTGSALYMIANTRNRGAEAGTQATAQQNVPEFYALDTTNGQATYNGAFIGSATATTPGVIPYGAAVIGNNLYFVGEKQESSGAVGYLYRVPISSGRPNGLAIEVGTLALSMTTTEDQPRGLAVAGGNLYLTAANGMLHTVRTDTGQITASRMLQFGGSALPAADGSRLTSALTASSDGMLHTALMSGNSKNAELFSINPTTAVMTKTGDITLVIPGETTDRTTATLTPTGLAYSGSSLYLLARGTSAEVTSVTTANDNNAADTWLFVR